MSRFPRRFVAALLWIAIALLPVRGLAAVLMPIAMAGMQPTAVVSAPSMNEAAVDMPCHAASKAGASGSDDNAPSTCSMCDLCHTTVAQTAAMSITLPELLEAPPDAVAPTALEPRAPDGLFRPPRTVLA